jgi:hypothetical protein
MIAHHVNAITRVKRWMLTDLMLLPQTGVQWQRRGPSLQRLCGKRAMRRGVSFRVTTGLVAPVKATTRPPPSVQVATLVALSTQPRAQVAKLCRQPGVGRRCDTNISPSNNHRSASASSAIPSGYSKATRQLVHDYLSQNTIVKLANRRVRPVTHQHPWCDTLARRAMNDTARPAAPPRMAT